MFFVFGTCRVPVLYDMKSIRVFLPNFSFYFFLFFILCGVAVNNVVWDKSIGIVLKMQGVPWESAVSRGV